MLVMMVKSLKAYISEGDQGITLKATADGKSVLFFASLEALAQTSEEKVDAALLLVTTKPAGGEFQTKNFAAVATVEIDGQRSCCCLGYK